MKPITVTPDQFRTIPCPTYPEIRLAVMPGAGAWRAPSKGSALAWCISPPKGPLGLAARRYCVKRGVPFTTAFHTKFPEYVNARSGVPVNWTYKMLRWFHKPSSAVMVATDTVEGELKVRGFDNIKRWSRGVDTTLFKPRAKNFLDLPRPIALYVGRVAVEKNIEAFLALNHAGQQSGGRRRPAASPALSANIPRCISSACKQGEELGPLLPAAADVFVFPSLTDTFGLVLLEALACGVPVAAYPVAGPLDVIGDAPVGCLHEDLGEAVERALDASPDGLPGPRGTLFLGRQRAAVPG